jgi:carbamoyl-phosphate synthase large subunit
MTVDLTVLVTGLGSTTAQSVLKGLRRQSTFELRIVGTDINNRTSIAGTRLVDAFEQVPLATHEDEYIDTLLRIIQEEGVDLLIPIVDIELAVLAANSDRIKRDCSLLLSDRETVEICNDKRRTVDFFEKHDIPTPATVDPAIEGRETIHEQLSFPLVAKPRRGVSSRDVYEIRSPEELVLLDRIENPTVQERCDGQEYTIDLYRQDNEFTAVPRKRLETRAGISYRGETVHDHSLIEYVRTIADALDIEGPANVQCFKSSEKTRFIEVNPRFSGSLPLTINAGINTPLYALRWANGDSPAVETSFRELQMCRYWEETYHEVTDK